MLAWLNGSKTYIIAAATIGYAMAGMWQGSIDQGTGMQMILGALGIGALRHGIATSK